MKEATKKDLYAAAISGTEYDKACKRVFQNKEIIAPILQMVVPEYKDCTIQEVIRCIDETTIEDVSVEDIPMKVDGLSTEMSSVTEKLILYDVHFKTVNPRLSTEQINRNSSPMTCMVEKHARMIFRPCNGMEGTPLYEQRQPRSGE